MAVSKAFSDVISKLQINGNIMRLENVVAIYMQYIKLVKIGYLIDFPVSYLNEWGLDIDLNNVDTIENYLKEVLEKAIANSNEDLKLAFVVLLNNLRVLFDEKYFKVIVDGKEFDFSPRKIFMMFKLFFSNLGNELTIDEITNLFFSEEYGSEYKGDRGFEGQKIIIGQIITDLRENLTIYGLNTKIKIIKRKKGSPRDEMIISYKMVLSTSIES